MKGQISAEMLILLAVVIAIVAIAAVYMMNAAKQGGQAVESRVNDVLQESGDTQGGTGQPGDPCDTHADCLSASCQYGYCR
ncbi:MAG: class III signal peptide-containing protein [Candidatus Micrarchaeota archaeon]|nr:class III signal peptide-containing protein [Candidatus Micrarchaeota archaeon]